METSLPVTSRARPPLPTTLTAWPPRHYSSDKGCAPPVARAHVTVEDAVSGQFATAIPGLAKPTFERLRRTRHAAQYFDPSSAEISRDDAAWALTTSRTVVEAAERLLGLILPSCSSSHRHRNDGASGDGVVKRAAAVGQPVGRSDGHLYRPRARPTRPDEAGLEVRRQVRVQVCALSGARRGPSSGFPGPQR